MYVRRNYNSQSTVENTWGTCPLQGNINIPVLLVDFSDLPQSIDASILTMKILILPVRWAILSFQANIVNGTGIILLSKACFQKNAIMRVLQQI